jgi:putative hydrolase of the HAD superfamily
MIKILLFDWGNTIMVDYAFPGPMYTWERVSWVPGAEKALQYLSSHYQCFLATNAGASITPEVLLALKRVGADKYFSGIFLAKEIGYEKPDLKFFTAIIERLGLPPSSIVMIGDNYQKDCIGGKNAGLRTALFNVDGKTGPFPMADAVFRSFDDLIMIIEKL